MKNVLKEYLTHNSIINLIDVYLSEGKKKINKI